MREISVVYHDGMIGVVTSSKLQRLIDLDEIVKFQRANGWVYPGIDPVRGHTASESHQGERRSA